MLLKVLDQCWVSGLFGFHWQCLILQLSQLCILCDSLLRFVAKRVVNDTATSIFLILWAKFCNKDLHSAGGKILNNDVLLKRGPFFLFVQHFIRFMNHQSRAFQVMKKDCCNRFCMTYFFYMAAQHLHKSVGIGWCPSQLVLIVYVLLCWWGSAMSISSECCVHIPAIQFQPVINLFPPFFQSVDVLGVPWARIEGVRPLYCKCLLLSD